MSGAGVNLRRRALLAAAGAALLPRRVPSANRASRIIVVGAGFGGATCAKYLRLLAPRSEVTLIDERADYLTGPFSNLVIAGMRAPRSITRSLAAIGGAHKVRTLRARVTDIDPLRLRVIADGRTLDADRLILSPGIAMRWELTPGLDAAGSASMPHAWTGDGQVVALRDRLSAVPEGALIFIAAPANPYRCPPGPYERASLMAFALKTSGRTRTKILIGDAKDDFTKSALFKLEWDTLYPGMIEWVPRASGGTLDRVDVSGGEIWLRGESKALRPQLASVIPAQRAADLAVRADLVDESGWCPVHAESFESTRHAGIHVVGDASIAAPMPKSAFAANSQAKLCASAVAAALAGAPAPDPKLLNTCYSLVSDHEAISVSGFYGAANDKLTLISEGMSPLSGSGEVRAREARQARAWYDNITADSFGGRLRSAGGSAIRSGDKDG